MSNYRKIYEQHHGQIPKDETGRTYEIHHIDGNHKNDSPDNLKAITIQEHYDIHYSLGDWNACLRIASRMELDPTVFSELAKKNAQRRVENGTHHFLDGEISRKTQQRRVEDGTHPFLTRIDGTSMTSDKVEDGTHPFLGPENNRTRIEDGTHPFLTRPDGTNLQTDRIENGTFHFMKRPDGTSVASDRVKDGTHNFITNHPCKTIIKCPYCPKAGPKPQMKRHHFDNCKFNPPKKDEK